MHYRRRDLVVLIYGRNPCCIDVVSPDCPRVGKCGLFIDLKKGEWAVPGGHGALAGSQTQKIGRMRRIENGCRSGIIGVYDRKKLGQLNSMVWAVQRAAKRDGYCLDD